MSKSVKREISEKELDKISEKLTSWSRSLEVHERLLVNMLLAVANRSDDRPKDISFDRVEELSKNAFSVLAEKLEVTFDKSEPYLDSPCSGFWPNSPAPEFDFESLTERHKGKGI